jgi:hypothetical protein
MNNLIEEKIKEFEKLKKTSEYSTGNGTWHISSRIARNFFKQSLLQVQQEERKRWEERIKEDVIGGIKRMMNYVSREYGTHKYDGCYKECIHIVEKIIKEVNK